VGTTLVHDNNNSTTTAAATTTTIRSYAEANAAVAQQVTTAGPANNKNRCSLGGAASMAQ